MSPLLQEILKQAEQLSLEDRAELIQQLSQDMKFKAKTEQSKPMWSKLKGMAAYPTMGEDEKAWVSRTRQEG
jgi:hypothetical protein